MALVKYRSGLESAPCFVRISHRLIVLVRVRVAFEHDELVHTEGKKKKNERKREEGRRRNHRRKMSAESQETIYNIYLHSVDSQLKFTHQA